MRCDADSGAPDSSTGSGERPLTAERNAQWLHGTSARVAKILRTVVPPLLDHPHYSVRAALTTGTAILG